MSFQAKLTNNGNYFVKYQYLAQRDRAEQKIFSLIRVVHSMFQSIKITFSSHLDCISRECVDVITHQVQFKCKQKESERITKCKKKGKIVLNALI